MPFHDAMIADGPLSAGDVLLACVLAFFLTRVILVFFPGPRGAAPDTDILPQTARAVMERCYALFPIETLEFGGAVFRRGMMVKITTTGSKTLTGRFLGLNEENFFCVLTSFRITADSLENVEDMERVD
jgi:hypothetical protein